MSKHVLETHAKPEFINAQTRTLRVYLAVKARSRLIQAHLPETGGNFMEPGSLKARHLVSK